MVDRIYNFRTRVNTWLPPGRGLSTRLHLFCTAIGVKIENVAANFTSRRVFTVYIYIQGVPSFNRRYVLRLNNVQCIVQM